MLHFILKLKRKLTVIIKEMFSQGTRQQESFICDSKYKECSGTKETWLYS